MPDIGYGYKPREAEEIVPGERALHVALAELLFDEFEWIRDWSCRELTSIEEADSLARKWLERLGLDAEQRVFLKK